MKPLTELKFNAPDSSGGILLRGISDAHLGNVFCNERELRAVVKDIAATKNQYVILLGDMLETITKNSVGDVWSQHTTPWQQIELAAEILEPIKDRIVAVTEGNHDLRAYKYDGLLPMRSVMAHMGFKHEEIEARYSCGGGVLFLGVDTGNCANRAIFTIYFKHGTGGGRTAGATANKLQQMKQDVMADVYIMAHMHREMVFPEATYIPSRDSLVEMRHLFVNSGSMLGWGGYAVQFGFPPSVVGYPAIELLTYRTKHDLFKIKRSTVTA